MININNELDIHKREEVVHAIVVRVSYADTHISSGIDDVIWISLVLGGP